MTAQDKRKAHCRQEKKNMLKKHTRDGKKPAPGVVHQAQLKKLRHCKTAQKKKPKVAGAMGPPLVSGKTWVDAANPGETWVDTAKPDTTWVALNKKQLQLLSLRGSSIQRGKQKVQQRADAAAAKAAAAAAAAAAPAVNQQKVVRHVLQVFFFLIASLTQPALSSQKQFKQRRRRMRKMVAKDKELPDSNAK